MVDLSEVSTEDLAEEISKRKFVYEIPPIRDEKYTKATFTKRTWDKARILVVYKSCPEK